MSQFDVVIDRYDTSAIKYDGLAKLYGKSDLLPMWVADMDFQAPKEVVEAVVARAQHGIYGYALDGDYYKNYPVAWQEKQHHIKYDPNSVFFTPSVLSSLNLAILAFTEENDKIMMSVPTYGPFVNIPTAANRPWVGSDLKKVGDTYTFDWKDFEQKIVENDVKIYILCNPHNPTGRVWTEEELIKVINICQKYGVFVISDEIHSDLIMPGQTFVPLMKVARQLGYQAEVMIMSSPTKTFNLAGLQVSYYLLENQSRQDKMAKVANYNHVSGQLNNFAYISMVAAYEYGSTYVSELTSYIYENYLYLKEELASHCPKAALTDLQATYLTWLNVDYLEITEEALKDETIAQGLAIQTNSDFFEVNDVCLRINLACPRATLKKGVALLIASLKALEK